MFRHGWTVWYLLLYAPLVLCSLDIIENDGGVTCSQELWDCTMQDGTYLDSNSVKVTDLSLQVKLCCRGHTCALCLLIHVEVDLGKPGEEEDSSGLAADEGTEETKDNEAETGSVTVRYMTPQVQPTFKKVEFIVNKARSSQQSTAQITMIITNVISYESLVSIDSPNVPGIVKEAKVPSLEDVCSSSIKTYVQECNVPKISFIINESNQVELHFPDSTGRPPVVCLQNELDGSCQEWNRKPIPLESVTPCTCFQAWEDNDQIPIRSRTCPFRNSTALRKNIWTNFTVSVDQGYIGGTMLRWNVSAPCRLEGEVWPCVRTPVYPDCTEIEGFRQQLESGLWNQNSNGFWENIGVFAKINLENHPCVMAWVKFNETKDEKGPFCYNNINRWRWSLFAVAVMLLISLTLLITVFLRDFIKKSVWSWRHGGFIKTVHKAHVLVISPLDSDADVLATVSSFASLLCSRGFSVTADLWCHNGQLSLGPLPWFYGQQLRMDSHDRVVLVLTPKAVERAQTWSCQDNAVIGLQDKSPYSDVFRACLFNIQVYKNQGRASECFVLVTFDSLWTNRKISTREKLPEILRGLPLFHLPSQTKSLLSDLCVGRTQRQSDRAKQTLAFSGHKNWEL